MTIDFESLPNGLVVTTELQAQGVHFSNASGPFNSGQIVDITAGDIGLQPFGNSPDQGMLIGGAGDALEITFVTSTGASATTDSASFRLGDGDPSNESFQLTFYDASGGILFQDNQTTTSGPTNGGYDVSFSGSGIHRIRVETSAGSPSGGAIDDLTFNSPTALVPEPSTYGLGLLLLLAIGVRPSRRVGSSSAPTTK